VQSEEAQVGTMVVQEKPKRKRRSKAEVEAAKDREAIERVKAAKERGPASTSTLSLHTRVNT
jgi:hypothetical protein